MAADDNSGARPAGPVVLRIKLRYEDLEAMVQRFAPNVGKSGLFLPTKSIQPVGTEVKFELRLINDVAVLVGLGRVKHVKHPNPDNPKAAFGMAIELTRVSREGREVIIRMLERRRLLGLPDVAIPIPEDVETARRAEIDSQPRADTSGVMRDAMTQLAAAPPSPAAQLLTAPAPGSGPIAVARESGPIVVVREDSKRIPVPVLTPERSRPARPRVQEMIDKAIELSARIVVVSAPELDMHVDLDRVLSRARALAGGDLDVELAALREAAATPVEIGVEAASAELARQLGGKPISKRERSARWSAPPPVEMKSELPPIVTRYGDRKSTPRIGSDDNKRADTDDFVAKTRAETEAAPAATIAAVVDTAVESQAAVEPVTAVDAAVEPSALRAPSEPSPSVLPEESYVIRSSAELVAQRDADAYDDAFVPNASTTTAVDTAVLDPVTPPKSFGPADEIKTDPAASQSSGLLIDDDADISSFERALDAARVHTGVSKVAPPRPGDHELDDEDGPAAELLASGEYQLADDVPNESTIIGVSPIDRYGASMSEQLAAQLDQQLAEAEAEAARELEAGMAYERPYRDGEEELEDEEISDLDVLAEADEDDEDLMRAHGEAEISSGHPAPASDPADDFASRLDLGDDDDDPAASRDGIDRAAAREFDDDVPQPIDDYSYTPDPDAHHGSHAPVEDYREPPSRQRARRASSETSYTVAEQLPHSLPHFAPHASGEEFDEPHSYAQEPVAQRGPDPRLLKHGRPTTQSTEDLEDALAALDVGRIDLESQRRSRGPAPSSGRPLPGIANETSRPLPGLPIERPRTGPVPVVAPVSNSQRVAHTVPRSQVRTTGQQVAQPQMLDRPPSGQHPVADAPRGKPPTAQQPVARARPTGAHSTAKPPPIPAAARKPTTQVPLMKPPFQPAPVAETPKRMPTDDGVLIDFDEDE